MSYTLILEWLGNGPSGHSEALGFETHRFRSFADAEDRIKKGSLKTRYDFFIGRMRDFLPKEGLEAKVADAGKSNAKPIYCLIEDGIDDRWLSYEVCSMSENVIVEPYDCLGKLKKAFVSGPKYGGKLRIAERLVNKWVTDMYISIAKDLHVSSPDDILKLNKTRRTN